ncbi:MAG: ribose 5-phosphate isomerase B [Coriobacteriia bacterium]|nr:ribose 5-phosphate isomerase B [Coriobacteriia bacterium]
MRVAIGSDHAGFEHKEMLRNHLVAEGHVVADLGTSSEESVDYPDFAMAVGRAVSSGDAEAGVLVCGTGIGMAIAANKIKGVRAANVTSPEFARLARLHNDANVITVSGRFVSAEINRSIVDAFLATDFEAGRHADRVAKISAADHGSDT